MGGDAWVKGRGVSYSWNKSFSRTQAQPFLFLSWSGGFCHESWQISCLVWILDYNEIRGSLKNPPHLSWNLFCKKKKFHVRFQVLLSTHFILLEFQTRLPQFLGSTNILNIIFILVKFSSKQYGSSSRKEFHICIPKAVYITTEGSA